MEQMEQVITWAALVELIAPYLAVCRTKAPSCVSVTALKSTNWLSKFWA
jgi:hypothetical protein